MEIVNIRISYYGVSPGVISVFDIIVPHKSEGKKCTKKDNIEVQKCLVSFWLIETNFRPNEFD